MDRAGCVLEAIESRRFVWTSASGPGFRPVAASDEGFLFTAILEFEPRAGGALYRATARHPSLEDARNHADMGFEVGWGAALEQLVEMFTRCSGEVPQRKTRVMFLAVPRGNLRGRKPIERGSQGSSESKKRSKVADLTLRVVCLGSRSTTTMPMMYAVTNSAIPLG